MGITPQRVREILKISQEPVSLENPVGEEGDSQLGDFIEDEDAGRARGGRRRDHAREELAACWACSRTRAGCIELRFGLSGEQPRTLEEVGQQFGVTRERIRQIEAKTLAKLRATARPQPARLRGIGRAAHREGEGRRGFCPGARLSVGS